MVPVLYVQMGNVVWKVFPNGTWERAAPDEPLLEGVQVVNQPIVELGDEGTLSSEQVAAIEKALSETLNDLTSNIVSQQGQVDLSSGGSSDSAGFVVSIKATLDETIARAGFDTRPSSEPADERNSEQASLDILSDQAKLTVDILDGGDGYENQFEVPSVVIQGTATDVRDGRIVLITVTDQDGNTIQLQSITSNQAYSVSDVDLSSLVEGPLTVDAIISDDFGNSITAQDTTIKDTLAIINVELDGFGDEFVNAAESPNAAFTGKTEFVESGQTINWVVTDELGGTVTGTASVTESGLWSISNLDVSGLSDGVLTVEASTIDIAGNPAVATDTIVKDTKADITVQFEDIDGIVNEVEISGTTLSGTVIDVEDGQSVNITISGSQGDPISLTTTVVNGGWTIPDVDLSRFEDGELSVTATTTDIAGNPATATDTSLVNTVKPFIDIDTLQGFNILAFRGGTLTSLQGTTNLVEEGLPVTVVVSDGVSTLEFQSAVDANGDWLVVDIDVSSLDLSVEWTLDAKVTNAIGNSAIDDMPTIVLPESLAFSDTVIGIFGNQEKESDVRIQDAEFVFFADQSLVDELTSNGLSITVSVSDYRVIGTRSDGEVVFEASLSGDQVDVAFKQVIDQSPDLNSIQTALLIQGTQTDADGTTEVVIGHLPINIADIEPLIFDDFAFMTEGEVKSGNVLNNDIDLDGALIVSRVIIDGSEYPVSGSTPTLISLPEGELSVFANGHYNFSANRNLDNSAGRQRVSFDYVAGDQENDFGQGTATIFIDDGEAGSIESSSYQYTEPDSNQSPQTFETTFLVSPGSDNPDPNSLYFSTSTLNVLDSLGLTSGASPIPLTYQLNDAGNTVTASISGNTVFTLSLSGQVTPSDATSVTANLTITQERPLNQPNKNDLLKLPLLIGGRDTDGTELEQGEFTLIIADGSDPILTSISNASVSEAELAFNPVVDMGQFRVELGADDLDTNMSLNPSLFFDIQDQPQVWSDGQLITYTIDATGAILTGNILDENDNKIPVFEIGFSQPSAAVGGDVPYTFVLLQNIDNTSDPLEIPFIVTARDSDGDEAKLTLNVSVSDSGNATLTGSTLTVTELPQKTTITESNSDTASISITAAQDDIVDIDLAITAASLVLDSSGNAITSNGLDILWRNNGDNSYDAVDENGMVVFRVALPAEIDVPASTNQSVDIGVRLFKEIDHGSVGDIDELSITLPIVVTDFDGTQTQQDSTLTILDGLDPSIETIALSVAEANLEATGEVEVIQSNTLTFVRGSDSIVSFDINVSDFGSYQSGGETIVLAERDIDGWFIGSTQNTNQEVFRLRLNVDGSAEFLLFKPLDHSTGDGANLLNLQFPVVATDKDGDTSSPTMLTVEVTDDIPTSGTEQTLEITEGDSFSGNLLSATRIGVDGGSITEVRYEGVDYDFSTTDPIFINLTNENDANSIYGTLELKSDGSYTITTITNVDADPALEDRIRFTVTDGDGDTVSNFANLILDDIGGFIRVENTEVREDELAGVDIKVFVGDIDQGENVTEITISNLQGGTLYYGGVELIPDAGGSVTLTDAQIMQQPGQNYFVSALPITYLPKLNESNTTLTSNVVALSVGATIARNGIADEIVSNQTLQVSVLPVADTPEWGSSQLEYVLTEDIGRTFPLDIDALLVDTDSSESLSYQITNIPSGITIKLDGSNIVEGKSYTQKQLDQMTVTVKKNLAGEFSFDLKATATEKGSDFAQSSDKTADIDTLVVIKVSPDADTPELSVRDIRGLEDVNIDLSDAIFGSLTDTDGSESLFYDIEVQDGWSFTGTGFVQTGTNSYRVESDAIANGSALLTPKADISSVTESLFIKVSAVSVESTIDGLTPVNQEASSVEKTINITLKGVVDEPIAQDGGNGHWQYDAANRTIETAASFYEDGLVPLDFLFVTSDDDISESLNILITNIPDDIAIVDSSGQFVALTIADLDPVTGPVYQVSNADLAKLFVKPKLDFSGRITFDANVVSTEPDGDSGTFDYKVQIDLLPEVDQSDGVTVVTTGLEDRQIALDLEPKISGDSDGSETLTGYFIDPLPSDLTLLFDGSPISVPATGLDLEGLIDSTTPTLDSLLNSGRLSVQATQDLSGTFVIPVRYEVTDTSELGEITTKMISGSLTVVVDAKVEGDTRLETSSEVFISDDGRPVDVSAAVRFIEEDIDGSEYLDYILLQVPQGYDIVVNSGTNEAQQTPDGNWIIPAAGLTSDTVQDVAAFILDNVTISSNQDTPVLDIVVRARVIDGEDSRYIDGEFQIQITGHSGGGTPCDPVGPPGEIESEDDITFDEGTEVLDLGQYLDPDIASDPDNEISFFIPSDSLPDDVELEGDGVIAVFDNDGDIIGYSISQTGLSNLKITGLDEDFAGCITFDIETTETSTCNGSSLTTTQTVSIAIRPIVDDIILSTAFSRIDEDVASDLDLQLVLGDSIKLDGSQTVIGEGESSTGKETVNSFTIRVSDGATLSGDPSWLTDNGDGSWTVTDVTRLPDVVLTPPTHFSGEITLTAEVNITDKTDCLAETDTQTKVVTKVIEINPIVDPASLVSADFTGDEDTYISLASLDAELIDQDGSENMSLSLSGVPEGAVVVVQVGSSFELVPNNGVDGGSFNGKPTYEWQLEASQLDNTFILPPLDFSGDIPLTLKAITQELATGDTRITESAFTLGVNPIADEIEFFNVPEKVNGDEDAVIDIPIDIVSQETNSDESIALLVTAKAVNDSSSIDDIASIRIDGKTARFIQVGDSATATIIVAASSINSIELFAGDAFGDIDLTIRADARDTATVLGANKGDFGPIKQETIRLKITPEPDAPILDLTHDNILAEASSDAPLGLSFNLVNPAADEQGMLTIEGLPDEVELTAGQRVGDDWEVSQGEIADLAIKADDNLQNDLNFTLILKPSAELNGNTADGAVETIDVEWFIKGDQTLIGNYQRDYISSGSGDDTMTGGLSADTFAFTNEDIGLLAHTDIITDFNASANSDSIDLSRILSATNASDAEKQLDLVEVGTDLRIDLRPNEGLIRHHIVLENTTLNDLYGGDAAGVSESDIIQKMLDDQNLILSSN
ncbi:type I secretion C-terminal target domain-containing protein [Vibrio sp. DNB22_10_4]